VFVDGFFRTGDLATRSPDGYQHALRPKSDLMISRGFNIYPREIEEFLEEHLEMAEAAVIGSMDPVRGEVPVAYVVMRERFDSADIHPALLGRDETHLDPCLHATAVTVQ
jgi:acyl-CoA synthetase (AMP-forming)/AMP-acid ligase II